MGFPSGPAQTRSTKRATRLSVLLVDDDPAASSMYGLGLAAAGFLVTEAGSARAALVSIEQEVPDVIIVDWLMPHMRGDELLEVLRQNEDTDDVAVLFLSNFPKHDPRVAGVVVAGSEMQWLVKSETTPAKLANVVSKMIDIGRRSPTSPSAA